MGKFKNAMNTAGKLATAAAEANREVNDMTNQLMQRTYGVDLEQARKIARVLVSQAEVTWK